MSDQAVQTPEVKERMPVAQPSQARWQQEAQEAWRLPFIPPSPQTSPYLPDVSFSDPIHSQINSPKDVLDKLGGVAEGFAEAVSGSLQAMAKDPFATNKFFAGAYDASQKYVDAKIKDGDPAGPFKDLTKLSDAYESMSQHDQGKLIGNVSVFFVPDMPAVFKKAGEIEAPAAMAESNSIFNGIKDFYRAARAGLGRLVKGVEDEKPATQEAEKRDQAGEKTVEGSERKFKGEGDVSPAFVKEVKDVINGLSAEDKAVFEAVNFQFVKNMSEVPGGSLSTGGGYLEHTIYLPEEILQNGRFVANDDVAFRLRHEIGHATNDLAGLTKDGPFSDQRWFINAFNRDFAKLSASDIVQLKMDRSPVDARDEVFADMWGHLTKESNAAYSQKMLQAFQESFKAMKEKFPNDR